MMHFAWFIMLLNAVILTFAFASPAKCEELWVVATVRSYHLDRTGNGNEANYGIGGEYSFNSSWNVAAGEYLNTKRRTSVYATVGYTPLHIQTLKFGGTVGAITGYTKRISPMFAFLASNEGKEWGGNLLAFPPFEKGSRWVFGLQIKRRF